MSRRYVAPLTGCTCSGNADETKKAALFAMWGMVKASATPYVVRGLNHAGNKGMRQGPQTFSGTKQPLRQGGRVRIGPQFFPLAGREQVTPPGGGAELFTGHHAQQAIMAGRQGHTAEKLAIGAAFGLRGVGRCGKIRGSKKLLAAFLICPHRRQASGAFLLGHATPPHRH